MKLSELQKKDIVNIKDGKKIGKIIDVYFDESSGYMIKFVIEKTHFVRNIFSNTDEIVIKFSQIKKMGEDVILIDIS
ncbi:MAG: YlmC/YmxH family sporulation protein [Tenericutes bacterium]|nr:YlmC/YmxH family sporulation protein [Mycoplasmatota bacterium]